MKQLENDLYNIHEQIVQSSKKKVSLPSIKGAKVIFNKDLHIHTKSKKKSLDRLKKKIKLDDGLFKMKFATISQSVENKKSKKRNK